MSLKCRNNQLIGRKLIVLISGQAKQPNIWSLQLFKCPDLFISFNFVSNWITKKGTKNKQISSAISNRMCCMQTLYWLTSLCVLRDPSSEEHLLPASPSEREIAVPVSPPATLFEFKDWLSPTQSHVPFHRKWTALCFYWLATSSTDGPTPGYAPITSAWSTSGAPIRWSRTHPWNWSPSQTGRHEVWKKRRSEESNKEKVIVSLLRFNNYTIFHELNQTQMSWLELSSRLLCCD